MEDLIYTECGYEWSMESDEEGLFNGYGCHHVQIVVQGASCIIKMWMLKIENTSEYNKTTDWQVSKNLIKQRGIYNEV